MYTQVWPPSLFGQLDGKRLGFMGGGAYINNACIAGSTHVRALCVCVCVLRTCVYGEMTSAARPSKMNTGNCTDGISVAAGEGCLCTRARRPICVVLAQGRSRPAGRLPNGWRTSAGEAAVPLRDKPRCPGCRVGHSTLGGDPWCWWRMRQERSQPQILHFCGTSPQDPGVAAVAGTQGDGTYVSRPVGGLVVVWSGRLTM